MVGLLRNPTLEKRVKYLWKRFLKLYLAGHTKDKDCEFLTVEFKFEFGCGWDHNNLSLLSRCPTHIEQFELGPQNPDSDGSFVCTDFLRTGDSCEVQDSRKSVT